MKKTVLILMLLTLTSKFLGLFREIALSFFYGASNISDIYLISLTIPSLIFGFVVKGIATGYIPMYSRINKNSGICESNRFTSKLINILIALCVLIVFAVLLFTTEFVRIFASGFQGGDLALATKFTRISIFGIFFTLLASVFSCFLHTKKAFIAPAFVAFPLNLVIIISIVISAKIDVILLAVGSVLAIVAQVLFLVPFVTKAGYIHKYELDFRDEYINKMARLSLPVIIGDSVISINKLIDRTIASQITVGGISALNYSNRIVWFIVGVFVTSIITVTYPTISKHAADDNIEEIKKSIVKSIGAINLFVIPASVGLIIFSTQIVELAFGRGAFDTRAIELTSNALLLYSFSILGIGLREVLSRVFYAFQDTKTPMISGAIGILLNIVLNLILSRFLGIGGLALATSLSAVFTALLMLISLRKKIGSLGIKHMGFTFLKTILASLVMAVICKVFYNSLIDGLNNSLLLILSVIFGVTIYFIIIFLLRIDGVDVVTQAFKRKIGKSDKTVGGE